MVEEKLRIIKLKKTLFFMLLWNYILTMSIGTAEKREPIEIIITMIMMFVPFTFYWNFKELFIRNRKHLKENFSIKVIFQSALEVIIFIFVLVCALKMISINISFLLGGILLILNATLLIFTKFLEITYKADDVRSRFFAAVNNTGDINQNVTMFWRLKIWLTPRFNIKNLRKNNNDIYRFSESKVIWIGFTLCFTFGSGEMFGKIIGILIIIWIFVITFIDRIFRTYVKFEGVCVDSEVVRVPKSERIDGYRYKIIDFHNQREINIFIKNEEVPRYKKWDKVAVIHGAFSKKIKDHYRV